MGVKTNRTSFLRGNRSEITDWNTHVTKTIPTEYHHVIPRTYKRKSKPSECDIVGHTYVNYVQQNLACIGLLYDILFGVNCLI